MMNVKLLGAPSRAMLAGTAIASVLAISLLVDGARNAVASSASPTRAQAANTAGNWDFERGNLTGWQTRNRGGGAWYAYSDGTTPPNPAETDPIVPFNVPQPPQGRYAAVTDMTAPGARILYRDTTPRGAVKLRFKLFYDNSVPFASPNTLKFDGRKANQQVRVELMDPSAPVGSTAAKHVLATIFKTAPGDPRKLAPREVTFDLSEWAGKRVRLRFAQVDNRGPLRAGIDDVRLAPLNR